MKPIPSCVSQGHADFDTLNAIRVEILRLAGSEDRLAVEFPLLIQNAMDFVLDPVRTGRTELSLLDNVEKTFVGLKAEHFLRDFLDVPKGVRDLVIGGIDVDVKNTVRGNWMIPKETYSTSSGACLLIACDEENRQCWLGLFLARPEYLNAPNQDKKRSLSAAAFGHILWLVKAAKFPESHWHGFDMARFRALRKVAGGAKRAAQFFRENLRKRIHRTVLLSLLFDQLDPMKRARGNGGARDILRKEGIAILSGFYDVSLLSQLGIAGVGADELIAVRASDEQEERLLRACRAID